MWNKLRTYAAIEKKKEDRVSVVGGGGVAEGLYMCVCKCVCMCGEEKEARNLFGLTPYPSIKFSFNFFFLSFFFLNSFIFGFIAFQVRTWKRAWSVRM